MSLDLSPALPLARRYRLAMLVTPPRGLPGDHLARGVGSSVEFQDFRQYVPGDDPRHIDWAALARTDQLIVRLHRADVQLAIEVLLDTSRSLVAGSDPASATPSATPPKAERAAQCAWLVALLGRRAGARVTVWAVGDEAVPMRDDLERRLPELRFEGRAPLAEVLDARPPRLETGSVRIVISDFLFPHDPQRLLGAIGRGAAGCAFLQILSATERDPAEEGHVRFVDVETGEERQMVIAAAAVKHYRERLSRLQGGLASSCRAAHAAFATLPAEASLEELCQGPLVREGVLEPA